MVSKVPVKYIRPAASFMTAACSTIQSPSVIHPKQPPLESCRYRCRNPVLSVAQLNPPCSSSKSTSLCPVLTSNIPHSDKRFPGYGDLTCTSRSPTKTSSPEEHRKATDHMPRESLKQLELLNCSLPVNVTKIKSGMQHDTLGLILGVSRTVNLVAFDAKTHEVVFSVTEKYRRKKTVPSLREKPLGFFISFRF